MYRGRHRRDPAPAPRRRRLLGEAARTLLVMSLMTVVSLSAWVFVPMAWGWDAYTVTSGSMAPLVRPGDVVIASGRPRDVPVGSLIVIEPELAGGEPVTHRVVEELPDGRLRTKGDANPQPDSRLIGLGEVAGSARLVVPLAGLIRLHLGPAAPALGLVLVLVSLAWPVVRRRQPGRPLIAAGLACAVTVGAGAAGTSWSTSRAVFTRSTDAAQSWATSLTYANAVAASGPAAHWRMGTTGTVADVQGGAALTLVNSPTLQNGALRGDTDRALRFARTNPASYATVPSNAANSFSGPFTVAAWTNAAGGVLQRIVFKGASGSLNYLLAWDSNGKYMRFVVDLTGGRVTVVDPAVWSTGGGWRFVAGVFDGTACRLYIDGVQVQSLPATTTPVVNSNAMTVSEPGTPGNGLAGDVDEVTLWNRALSVTELQNLYRIGKK